MVQYILRQKRYSLQTVWLENRKTLFTLHFDRFSIPLKNAKVDDVL